MRKLSAQIKNRQSPGRWAIFGAFHIIAVSCSNFRTLTRVTEPPKTAIKNSNYNRLKLRRQPLVHQTRSLPLVQRVSSDDLGYAIRSEVEASHSTNNDARISGVDSRLGERGPSSRPG
jgi:hypothetical protein